MDYRNILLIIAGYIYLFVAIVVTVLRISIICVNTTIMPELLIYYCLKVFTGLMGILYGLVFITRLEYYLITPFIAVFMLDFITLAVIGILQLKSKLTILKKRNKIHPRKNRIKINKQKRLVVSRNSGLVNRKHHTSSFTGDITPTNRNYNENEIMAQYIFNNIHGQTIQPSRYPINNTQGGVHSTPVISEYAPQSMITSKKKTTKHKKTKKTTTEKIKDIYDDTELGIFDNETDEEDSCDDESDEEDSCDEEEDIEEISEDENPISSTMDFIREFI